MKEKVVGYIKSTLHIVEIIIAIMTVITLLVMLVIEIYKMFSMPQYYTTVDTFMGGILGIVIGLEFVRLLIDFTPANTIELMSFAVARQFIISHDEPLSNVVAVICIAGLFAIKKFLIPKRDMNVEITKSDEDIEK